MKLRTAINFIRYATLASAILFAIAGMLYFAGWDNVNYWFAALLFFLASVIIALGKKYWIRYLLRQTKYPGIFYSVCSDLNLLRNMDIFPGDDVLDDLYKPIYSTDDFLADNSLSSSVYPATSAGFKYLSLFYWIIPLCIFTYNSSTHALKKWDASLLMGGSYLAGMLAGKLLKRKIDPGAEARFTFDATGMHSGADLLDWWNIASWTPTKVDKKNFLAIRLKQPVNGHLIYQADIDFTNISMVEYYILISHYKYKYGYDPNDP